MFLALSVPIFNKKYHRTQVEECLKHQDPTVFEIGALKAKDIERGGSTLPLPHTVQMEIRGTFSPYRCYCTIFIRLSVNIVDIILETLSYNTHVLISVSGYP